MVSTDQAQLSNFFSDTMSSALNGDVARLEGALWKEWMGLVKAEERTNLLRGLLLLGLGTNDIENFVGKQESLRFRKDGDGKVSLVSRENVKNLMGAKLSDSEDDVSVRRVLKDWLRNKLEKRMKNNVARYKKFCNKTRDNVNNLRKELKLKNENKVRHIRMRRKQESKFKLPPELERYKYAGIFTEGAEEHFKPGQILGPVVVGGNSSLLSKMEAMVLTKGPKFTISRVLSKEKFLVEMEKAFIKVRWSLKDDDEVNLKDLTDEERAEKMRLDEIAGWEQAKSRMVHDKEDNTINFRKQRCTDTKHNTRLILPGPLSNQRESELNMRRVQWSAIYDEYIAEFCDEEGVQEANLSKEESMGLESLEKRVADGSLIICQTDKSSRFAVMRKRNTWRQAGSTLLVMSRST